MPSTNVSAVGENLSGSQWASSLPTCGAPTTPAQTRATDERRLHVEIGVEASAEERAVEERRRDEIGVDKPADEHAAHAKLHGENGAEEPAEQRAADERRGGEIGVEGPAEELYRQAKRLTDEGALQEAVRAYRELLAIEPSHLRAHNNLGVVYDRLGDHRSALAEYQAAMVAYLRLQP